MFRLLKKLFSPSRTEQRYTAPPPQSEVIPFRPANNPMAHPPTSPTHLPSTRGQQEVLKGRCWVIDGDTIVIGANQVADESGNGRAYVYTRSGGIWTEQTILAASNGASDDRFGGAVAVDGGNIVVGAHRDDNENGEDSGSAYAFVV